MQDVATAFEQQSDLYRGNAWSILVTTFASNFPSLSQAEDELLKYLYTTWRVSSLAALAYFLKVGITDRSTLFDLGAQSLCWRVLICRAISTLSGNVIDHRREKNKSCVRKGESVFASTVRRHALLAGIDEASTIALMSPGNIRDIAASAGLVYNVVYQQWKRVLNSMLAELGEDAVREMLPEGRRFHKVKRVGNNQDLASVYRKRISAVLQQNPAYTRADLWLEHNRAMRYLSEKDYDWLAQLIGGNMLTRRAKNK